MITITTSNSSNVNPLTFAMVPPLLRRVAAGPFWRAGPLPGWRLLVDAELHGRLAGLRRADVGGGERIVEVRDAHPLAVPRARRVELVHAARAARRAVARLVDHRAGRGGLRPVRLRARRRDDRPVVDVAVHVVA